MNNRQDGSMSVVRWLQGAGVARLFSVSGGPLNGIYHACSVLGLPLVHTRNEAAACFMADAAARITGQPGAVAVTLGPGVTNTVTPALVAAMAGSPLLILGAQAPIRSFERGAAMSWDPLPILSGVTKWCARCHEAERIPEYLDMAWRKMWAGRPGPVFLELPVDVLAQTVEEGEGVASPVTPPRPRLSEADAGRLADMIAGAQRPFMILGDETYWDRADGLEAAIERHGVAFATMRLARGIVDETHPLCAGPAYVPCNGALRQALAEADCVLMMGHHFEYDLEFGDGVNSAARVVQIASDPDLLNRNRRADLAIQASPAGAVAVLAEAPPMPVERDWADGIAAAWRKEHHDQLGDVSGAALHPLAAVDAVCAAAPENTIFVTSHGNVDFWADARLKLRRPGRYLRPGQSGTLGAEIPYGIGARFADPEAPVIVFTGDGGVGYSVSELDTAERYGRAVVVVVLDDEGWGAIGLPQERAYGERYEMRLPRRDWVRVAEGLGGGGVLARSAEAVTAAVTEAVSKAMAAGKPQLVQVPVAAVLSPFMDYISP